MSKRVWRTVDFHPEDTWCPDTGRSLQYKTRFGWKTVSMGQPEKLVCGARGVLFAKHLYRKNGKCRRCGLLKVNERNWDSLKKVEV